MKQIDFYRLLLVTITIFLVACDARNSAKQANHNYAIQVQAASTEVGVTELLITIKDENGQPIDDAIVNIKGDMSHAGMQPVLGESSVGSNGTYSVPYEWTMAGDWFVTVDVTLADGTVVSERVDFSGIGSSEEMEMDHSNMELEEAEE